MLLKSTIDEVSGLRFLLDRIDIKSGVGRRMLLSSGFMLRREEIERELQAVSATLAFVSDGSRRTLLSSIELKLSMVRDIKGSLNNLEKGQILDDTELFEVKHFAIVSEEIKELLNSISTSPIRLNDVSAVVNLLDPQKSRIPSFYIYDSYSDELAAIRKEIKKCSEDKELTTLYDRASLLEDRVRESLSGKLRSEHGTLKQALEQVGRLDILISKAKLAMEQNLTCPVIADTTSYTGLFNPLVCSILTEKGKKYQAVDIMVPDGVTLISGANMAGKTVLLKTLALSQHLCQFGFFVPAKEARITPVHKVITCIGDDQNEVKGLSAFASEIIKLSSAIGDARKDSNMLILFDELARTTNPAEGKAIVAAAAAILNELKVKSVITSHYSGIEAGCRKLRVKGLSERQLSDITPDTIADFMDYTLEEDITGDAPHEAIRIAGYLGVDPELLMRASKEIEKNE